MHPSRGAVRAHGHAIVAGGAGFIGAHLVSALLDRGMRVTVLDNLSSGRRGAVPSSPRARFRWHDISEPLPELERADVMFHLASPAAPADYLADPQAALDANDLGTRRLLERASRDRAVLVYASSSEVYGDIEPGSVDALHEDHPGRVHLARTRSCYAEAKRFGEELVLAAVRRRGVDARVVRLFNVYGPGMDPNGAARVVPAFIRAALKSEPLPLSGDGLQTRSFCWIGDAIDGLVALADRPSLAGAVVNLGNPEMVTIRELGESILELVGGGSFGPVARDPHEPRWRRPDISRAQTLLGWRPTVPLQDGLERVLESARGCAAPARGVGIVVPTFGRSSRLVRLLRALDDLTPGPAEIVIVDDGTPGGPPAFLDGWQRFRSQARRTVLRHARNKGPAAARNTGVRALESAFVAFTDDDCRPERTWAAQLARALREAPRHVAGVGGSVRARGSDVFSRYYQFQRILEPPSDTSYLVTANACFRKDLVDAVGGFDEAIREAGGEDPGLCFSLAREGFRFFHVPDAVVEHDFRRGILDFARTFYRYGKGCAHVARGAG